MEFVDFLTVFICALLFFFLDWIFHSKYFVDSMWAAAKGKKKSRLLDLCGRSAASLVLVFFAAFFENYLQVVHFWDGVIAGAIIAFGFLMPTHFFLYLRGVESVKIFFLESAVALFNMMLVGGILAG
jgi:hypothetical protein